MNPDSSKANKEPIEFSTLKLAEELTRLYPQVVDSAPIWIFTGSLAIKLALIADKIEILDVHKEESSDIPTSSVVQELVSKEEKATIALKPPKDIDYVRANEGFYDNANTTSWDKHVFEHVPTRTFRDWRLFGDKEYLLEQFQSQAGTFSSAHPMYKSWARILIGEKTFLTINPMYACALRNIEEIAGQKNKQETHEYIQALKGRFPDLYRRI